MVCFYIVTRKARFLWGVPQEPGSAGGVCGRQGAETGRPAR